MTIGLRRRLTLTIGGFGLVAVTAILTAPLVGSTHISLRRALDRTIPFADNVDAQIFFIARLPRTLAGALVGSMLASAGVVFQGLLRNPLATPFTLGVSAGAGRCKAGRIMVRHLFLHGRPGTGDDDPRSATSRPL